MRAWEHGSYQGHRLKVSLVAHADFFTHDPSRVTLREQVVDSLAGQVTHEQLREREVLDGKHDAVWMSDGSGWQCDQNHPPTRRNGLIAQNFIFTAPAKDRSNVAFVGSGSTFGQRSWVIRVTFKAKAAGLRCLAQPPSQELFVSRASGKLLRSIFKSRLAGELPLFISIRQRFGHYGEPLKIALPKQCRLSQG